jgi:rhombotail lipoprotein
LTRHKLQRTAATYDALCGAHKETTMSKSHAVSTPWQRRHWLLAACSAALAGCASMDGATKQRQVASMLGFLFPGKDQPPQPPNQVAVINVPFRIGVAFVPDSGNPAFRLSETDRLRLAGQVRDSFANYPFIKEIEAVPSLYLERGGGFENLDRVAALLRLDVIALISFDQVQYAGANKWSFLYWTGIGAYLVEGDQYDVMTAVETAVFDIKSRRMLMHASGTSTVKGDATWVGFAERSRTARTTSFTDAVAQMTERLHTEVKSFRERAPKDANIRLVLPPGYSPASPAAGPIK